MNPIPPNYPNGMVPPGVPPQPIPPQYPGYPAPSYPMFPGIPPYPPAPNYPGVPPYGVPQYPGYPPNSNDGSRKSFDKKGRNRGRDRHRRSRDHYRDDDSDDFQPSNLDASPIHTVFFCNIPYEVSYEKFEKFVSQYGETINIFSVFPHGFAFATYDDIRDAKKAVESTDDYLDGRRIRRAFAYKPPSHARKNPCDSCSTVLVSSLEDVTKITADDVIGKMREFGEIRGSNQDRPRSGEFVVKFFKHSDAKKAVAQNGLDLKHETLKIEFLPEEDIGEEDNGPKYSSGRSRRDRHRRRNDYSDSDDDSSRDDKKPDQMMPMMPMQQWPNYNMPMPQQFPNPSLYPPQPPIPGNPSLPIQPPMPGQNVQPQIPGQNIQPQMPAQNMQPPMSGQQLQPPSQPSFGNPQQFGF